MVPLLLLTWLFHCYCFDCFCCCADTEGCCSKTIALHVWMKEVLAVHGHNVMRMPRPCSCPQLLHMDERHAMLCTLYITTCTRALLRWQIRLSCAWEGPYQPGSLPLLHKRVRGTRIRCPQPLGMRGRAALRSPAPARWHPQNPQGFGTDLPPYAWTEYLGPSKSPCVHTNKTAACTCPTP
jgi:hypothetical protein